MLYIFWILGMLAFKLAILDQCQCILLCVRILLAKHPPFSTTSETLSYTTIKKYFCKILPPTKDFCEILPLKKNLVKHGHQRRFCETWPWLAFSWGAWSLQIKWNFEKSFKQPLTPLPPRQLSINANILRIPSINVKKAQLNIYSLSDCHLTI